MAKQARPETLTTLGQRVSRLEVLMDSVESLNMDGPSHREWEALIQELESELGFSPPGVLADKIRKRLDASRVEPPSSPA